MLRTSLLRNAVAIQDCHWFADGAGGSVELYLDPNGNEVLVSWQKRAGAPSSKPFHVSQATLSEYSEKVRRLLNDLNAYLYENPRLDEQRDPSWAKYAAILRDLKKRGRSLYFALFQSSNNAARAQELEMAIRALGRDGELNVHCSDNAVTLPLGFVCDPPRDEADDEDELPAITSPSRADFNECWINRFNITMLLDGTGCELCIDHETLRTVYALHTKAIEKAVEELTEGHLDSELERFLALCALELGKRDNWNLVRKACTQLVDFNGVIFVLAHAEDGNLCLAEKDTGIDPLTFTDMLKHRLRGDRSKLLILNCCASTVGAEGNSLLSAVTDRGFCGLIGTEAEILNTGALRCGSRLLWEMYFNGKPLGAAFQTMQDAPDLFPFNLFYTCYAERGLQLDMPLEARRTHDQDALVRSGTP
jgi:hypothetical protein